MKNLLQKQSVIKVKNYLNSVNSKIELIVLEETARTALDASNSLKKNVGSIVKSLLFRNNDKNKFYLCLISGDNYISLKKLTNIIGEIIVKADAEECKEVTGFSIGGVSPFAHKSPPSKILIDKNLKRFDTVYAAAGHPSVVFRISFNQLCTLTKGNVTDIV